MRKIKKQGVTEQIGCAFSVIGDIECIAEQLIIGEEIFYRLINVLYRNDFDFICVFFQIIAVSRRHQNFFISQFVSVFHAFVGLGYRADFAR